MVHALKMGWMKPTKAKTEEEKEENFYMLWKEAEEVLDYQYLYIFLQTFLHLSRYTCTYISLLISTSLSRHLSISLQISLHLSSDISKTYKHSWRLILMCLLQSEITRRYRAHLPAPKMPLPGHAESYNPPPEYLLTKEEV